MGPPHWPTEGPHAGTEPPRYAFSRQWPAAPTERMRYEGEWPGTCSPYGVLPMATRPAVFERGLRTNASPSLYGVWCMFEPRRWWVCVRITRVLWVCRG